MTIEENKNLIKEIDPLTVYSLSKNILETYFPEKLEIPIDIISLAQVIGIEIKKQPLNSITNADPMIATLLININPFTKERSQTIYVDEQSDFLDQRFAIARELARYLLFDKNMGYTGVSYTTTPILSVNPVDITLDLFATFLLLPPKAVQNQLETETNAYNAVPEMKNWIQELSHQFLVPYEVAVNGYQNIRLLSVLEKNITLETTKKVLTKNDPSSFH